MMKKNGNDNCNGCLYKKMSILEWVGTFCIIITVIFIVIYLIIKSFFSGISDSVITTINVALSAILGVISVFLGILSYNGSNENKNLQETIHKMQSDISKIHDFTYNLVEVNNDLKEIRKYIESIPELKENIKSINDLVIKTDILVDNINKNIDMVRTNLQYNKIVMQETNPQEAPRKTGTD